MTELPARPLVLLLIPADWQVEEQASCELQQFVRDEYGAGLWVKPLDDPAARSRLRLIGNWNGWSASEVQQGLAVHLASAFFSLG
ncbi:hypothetical protein MF271_23745 (plasmid) [Deinococcus sp. KNUC1210]|uniref:hypothetical protein n=1 Tax=Deinococcus sp. KNUC1210 TaxID=2917691 RepID=UPI001EF118B3|nr:hypothetical protein [Deinococcus sp. KNUC1210]ULH17978.1 hypothetical protein MF271_23745 [Deinococcus sp. KNUC1210]